jgi:excisionase family DNA binding protein
MERLAISVVEAAESVGISERKARALVAEGTWPVVRVGTRVLIPVRDLRSWLEGQMERVGLSETPEIDG